MIKIHVQLQSVMFYILFIIIYQEQVKQREQIVGKA